MRGLIRGILIGFAAGLASAFAYGYNNIEPVVVERIVYRELPERVLSKRCVAWWFDNDPSRLNDAKKQVCR